MRYLLAPLENSSFTISVQIANMEDFGHLQPAAILKEETECRLLAVLEVSSEVNVL